MKYKRFAQETLTGEEIGQVVDIIRSKMFGGRAFPWYPEIVISDFFTLQTHCYYGISENGKVSSFVIFTKYGDRLWLCNQWGEGVGWKDDMDELLEWAAGELKCNAIEFYSTHTKGALEKFLPKGYNVIEDGYLVRKDI